MQFFWKYDLSGLPKGINKIYSFEAKVKYDDLVKYYCPARLEEKTRLKIEDTAKNAFKSLGLRDYARVDIRLQNGVAFVIEINSLPGLDKGHSDICKMVSAMDMEYDDLIKGIVIQAINRMG